MKDSWLKNQPIELGGFKSCGLKSAKIKVLFDKISKEFNTPDPFNSLIMEGLILEIFGEIFRHISGNIVDSEAEIAQRAMEILHDHIEERVSLEELSAALSVQKLNIARSFKKVTGLSIGEYVRKIKIQKACELLRDTKLPISEIALEAGFCDQSHLNNVFKSETQTTPLVFRKNCLAG